MTKSLEATRPFQTYKQRLGHDINGIRPVMIPDDSGEWVNRHAAEHLAEQLERTKQEKSHLEFRLKNVQDAFLAGDERALRAERRIAYLEKTLRGTEESLIAATDHIAELEARPLCVKLPEDFPDDEELMAEIEFLDDESVDIKTAQWLKELRRRRAAGGTVEGE